METKIDKASSPSAELLWSFSVVLCVLFLIVAIIFSLYWARNLTILGYSAIIGLALCVLFMFIINQYSEMLFFQVGIFVFALTVFAGGLIVYPDNKNVVVIVNHTTTLDQPFMFALPWKDIKTIVRMQDDIAITVSDNRVPTGVHANETYAFLCKIPQESGVVLAYAKERGALQALLKEQLKAQFLRERDRGNKDEPTSKMIIEPIVKKIMQEKGFSKVRCNIFGSVLVTGLYKRVKYSDYSF
jgi:hypothetical protein